MQRLFHLAESYLESLDSKAAELTGIYKPETVDDVQLPDKNRQIYVSRRAKNGVNPGSPVFPIPQGTTAVANNQVIPKPIDDDLNINNDISLKRKSHSEHKIDQTIPESILQAGTPPGTVFHNNVLDYLSNPTVTPTIKDDEDMVGLHLSASVDLHEEEEYHSSQGFPFHSPLSKPTIVNLSDPALSPLAGSIITNDPIDIEKLRSQSIHSTIISLPYNNSSTQTTPTSITPLNTPTSSSGKPILLKKRSSKTQGIIIEREVDVENSKEEKNTVAANDTIINTPLQTNKDIQNPISSVPLSIPLPSSSFPPERVLSQIIEQQEEEIIEKHSLDGIHKNSVHKDQNEKEINQVTIPVGNESSHKEVDISQEKLSDSNNDITLVDENKTTTTLTIDTQNINEKKEEESIVSVSPMDNNISPPSPLYNTEETPNTLIEETDKQGISNDDNTVIHNDNTVIYDDNTVIHDDNTVIPVHPESTVIHNDNTVIPVINDSKLTMNPNDNNNNNDNVNNNDGNNNISSENGTTSLPLSTIPPNIKKATSKPLEVHINSTIDSTNSAMNTANSTINTANSAMNNANSTINTANPTINTTSLQPRIVTPETQIFPVPSAFAGHITPILSNEDTYLNKDTERTQDDEINMLNTEINLLKKQNLEMNIELDDLDSKLLYTDKQLTKALEQIDLYKQENEELKVEIRDVKQKNDEDMTHTIEIITLKEDHRLRLEQSVKDSEAKVYRLQAEVDQRTQRVTELQQQLNILGNDHKTHLEELNQQISYLQEQLNDKNNYLLSQDEQNNKKRKETDSKITEMSREITMLQKQLEGFRSMNLKSEETSVSVLEGKIISLEGEISALKCQLNGVSKERDELQVTVDQQKKEKDKEQLSYTSATNNYEKQIKASQIRIKELEKGETEQINLLSMKIEKMNQTIANQQLLLESVKSEKSSLEFRLAENMREQARLRHATKSTRYDIESNTSDKSLHVRKVSRLFCSANNGIIQKWDTLDDHVIRFCNNLVHVPIYRLLVCSYVIMITFLLLFYLFK
ncbi:hypothetical protein WA158_000453 [Blastocystis sp. Blastoise]